MTGLNSSRQVLAAAFVTVVVAAIVAGAVAGSTVVKKENLGWGIINRADSPAVTSGIGLNQ